MRRWAVIAATAFLVAVVGASPAGAIEPWAFDADSDTAPDDTAPGPVYPMRQAHECVRSAVKEDSQFDAIPAQEAFEVRALHALARGDGQTVAVIDSGVQAVSRLPNLDGGGDYLGGSDGLEDCDHHGTIVASIIAAQPSANDGFVGVAPGARIISIRQLSGQYTEDNPPQGLTPQDKSAASLLTLAKSVVHAANLGATVINMSLVACVAAGSVPDLRALAGALYYATVVRNAVVVAAAGNTGGDTCQANPGYDANNPTDPRNWAGVRSVPIPAFFDKFVLSVGGTTTTGDPYANSMPGPWVSVAAPATSIVGLDPTEPQPGALVNLGQLRDGSVGDISGTSYAAAYVSGLVALVRERYPKLTANQVADRIRRTAHTPSSSLTNILGSGIADPVAALTATLDPGPVTAPGIPPQAAAKHVPPPPRDTVPGDIATLTAGCAVAVLATASVIALARRQRSR